MPWNCGSHRGEGSGASRMTGEDRRKVTRVAPSRVVRALEMTVFTAKVAKVSSYTAFSRKWVGRCVDGLKERPRRGWLIGGV